MHPFRIVSTAAALALAACGLVASPAMAATSGAVPATVPTQVPGEPWATSLDHTIGHSASDRWIHLYGSDFTALDQVLVDGVPASDVMVVDDSTATFLLDIAPDYQPGTVAISLVSDDGAVVPTPVTFTYKATSGVDKQMAYAFSHWNLYSSKRFGYITGNDCVDFTSQTLLARGWKQSSQWFDKGAAVRSKLPSTSATTRPTGIRWSWATSCSSTGTARSIRVCGSTRGSSRRS